MRCVHEASLYQDNAFITLTYDDEHLPHDGSLNKAHWQKFMKRLRFSTGAKIRYFHCGEYGDSTARPHYHACLFGFDFPDKVLYSQKKGVNLYYSAFLEQQWGLGHCTVGDVTFESAAYVARYVVKKRTGKTAEEHYLSVNPLTGEISKILPEYVTMSRGGRGPGGGIAKAWFEKWTADVYPADSVVINGKEVKPPKYYDKLYELTNPETLEKLKRARIDAALARADDLTPERLKVREKIQQLRQRKLQRDAV